MILHELTNRVPDEEGINQLESAIENSELSLQEQLKQERDDFWRWYQDLEEEKKEFEAQVKQDYENQKSDLSEELQTLRDDYVRLETEKERYKNLYKYEKGQNVNFIRLATERAAQKSGVPKKDHPAYFFINSEQWSERIRNYDYDMDEVVPTWKIVIQTPYDSCHDYCFIEHTIIDDLTDKIFPLCETPISFFSNTENGDMQKLIEIKDDDLTYIYKWSARANFKSGFWEITIFTTHELRGIPQHLTLCHTK